MRVTEQDIACTASALATLALLFGACAKPSATGYTPGLGEFMTLVQARHIKLWFAGAAKNWPLADYELHELEEGLSDAARLHPTHEGAPRPLTELIPELTDPPLNALHAAVADRNSDYFASAYDSLTDGCNACHRATGFSFNVVSRPTTNPFSNQEFRIAP